MMSDLCKSILINTMNNRLYDDKNYNDKKIKKVENVVKTINDIEFEIALINKRNELLKKNNSINNIINDIYIRY
jgi:hypothetical protein